MELTTKPRTLEEIEHELHTGSDHLAFIPYAEALRAHGRLGIALKICQQGLAKFPTSVAGRMLLARVHYDMGKYELAEQECERVLREAPQSVSVRKLLALLAIKHRKFIKALGLLEELNGSVPDDAELITALLEVQRGLAERFSRDLVLAGSFTEREKRAVTREDMLAQIRERAEVRRCDIVAADDADTAWGVMLREWEADSKLLGLGGVRFALFETDRSSILIRELGVAGKIVVTLTANANFGAIKHLVEKFVQLPADENSAPATNSGDNQGAPQ